VAPQHAAGIILANAQAMALLVELVLHNDLLKALEEEDMIEGGEGDADDHDIFKTLPLIENVEMSSKLLKEEKEGGG